MKEVRNAPRTLKRAAPTAVFTVTVLYVLANVAYVGHAVLSKAYEGADSYSLLHPPNQKSQIPELLSRRDFSKM